MKIKLAITLGFIIWIFTYILTSIFNPIFTDYLPHINISVPIIIILITTLFGIIYIRNIEENEVIEGILVGIVFIAIDIICDMIFFIIPNNQSLIVADYPLHVISMIIIILTITTFLGYLAQMTIDLKWGKKLWLINHIQDMNHYF